MKRFLVAVVLSIGVAGTSSAQFRASVSAASIVVSVHRDGKPVTGLRTSDFVLTDAGVEQVVTAVDSSNVPLDLTFVLRATFRRGLGQLDTAETDLRSAVATLSPSDKVRILVHGDSIRELMALAPPSALPALRRTEESCSRLYEALTVALLQAPVPERHAAIIAIDEDEGTGIVPRDAAFDLARRSTASVHVLMLRPPPIFNENTRWRTMARMPTCTSAAFDFSPDRRAEVRAIVDRRVDGWDRMRRRVVSLAEATGGGEIRRSAATGSIAGDLRRLLNELRSSYILYYTPTGVPETGWHPTKVTMRDGRLRYELKHRPGFQR